MVLFRLRKCHAWVLIARVFGRNCRQWGEVFDEVLVMLYTKYASKLLARDAPKRYLYEAA